MIGDLSNLRDSLNQADHFVSELVGQFAIGVGVGFERKDDRVDVQLEAQDTAKSAQYGSNVLCPIFISPGRPQTRRISSPTLK